MTTTKAKRGDLVALHFESSSVSVEHGRSVRSAIEIHLVTGVTREGVVKATRPVHGSDLGRCERYEPEKPQPIARRHGLVARYVIPAAHLDVARATAAVLAHAWPGYPGQVKPYDSLAEAREALRPFLRRTKTREEQ